MLKKISTVVAVLLVAGATVIAGEVKLDGVKCVIADKPASADKSADYKDGKVYFCCGGCASKFTSDAKKHAVKANHQLVATQQYVQKKCPFSGGDLDESISTKFAGTKVGFCCNGCKGKVESAKDDAAKMKLVFSEKAFAKGFEKAKAEK